MRIGALLALVLLLPACGGGGASAPLTPQPGGLPTAAPSNAPSLLPTTQPNGYVSTVFAFGAAGSSTQSLRSRQYLPKGMNSATISLTASSALALNAPISVNVKLNNCPCVVNGPLVPPGTDTFDVSVYDGPLDHSGVPSGNKLAEGATTTAIAAGTANDVGVTLKGIPAGLSIASLSSASVDSFSMQPVKLSVLDADKNTITGDYFFPVTVAVADGMGNPNVGLGLVLNACAPQACAAASVVSTTSSDDIELTYGGFAMKPAVVSAAFTDASNTQISTSTFFTPALRDMTLSLGANTASVKQNEIDLFAQSGIGSTGSFTVNEPGFSDKPYGNVFSAAPSSPNGCAKIASLSSSSGTAFTVSAVPAPAPGSCTINVTDGVHSSPLVVTVTYTTSTVTVK
ncbi:MAG TPA: hypothetical protein VFE17_06035 [Candidatus Baltobacteraceae bacterium]|nr:hypothetical protein [Candidatus Baltobacteraceae bacterium]